MRLKCAVHGESDSTWRLKLRVTDVILRFTKSTYTEKCRLLEISTERQLTYF